MNSPWPPRVAWPEVGGGEHCDVCKPLACGLTSLSGNHLITWRHCAGLLLCPGAKLISNGHTLLGLQAIYQLHQVGQAMIADVLNS